MDWFRDHMKRGMNPRTYYLVAFLVAVLFWIHSLDVEQKALRAKNRAWASAPGAAGAFSTAAHSAVGKGTAVSFDSTPLGWGSDPFGRRVMDVGEVPGKARPAPRGGSAANRAFSPGNHVRPSGQDGAHQR